MPEGTTVADDPATLAALDRARAALRRLPDEPMPADVATRLDAALRAEPSPGPGATLLPMRDHRRRRWLTAAGAIVLLAGGGTLAAVLVTRGTGGGSTAVSSAGAPAAAGGVAVTDSGRDYPNGPALDAGVRALLAGRAAPAAPPVPSAARPAPTPVLGPALPACLRQLSPGTPPLAVESATYAGMPSLVIVFATPDPARVAVFVVGPHCDRADEAGLRTYRTVDLGR